MDEEQVVEVGIASEKSGLSLATTTPVEIEPTTAAIPVLGLVVDLESPNAVAQTLKDVREAKRQLDAVRPLLERALVEEAERQGTKTLHFGDLTATVSGGPATDYDLERLEELLAAGLPQERFEKLVKTEITYKLDRSVLRQVASSERYAPIVEAAKIDIVKPFRVDVS